MQRGGCKKTFERESARPGYRLHARLGQFRGRGQTRLQSAYRRRTSKKGVGKPVVFREEYAGSDRLFSAEKGEERTGKRASDLRQKDRESVWWVAVNHGAHRLEHLTSIYHQNGNLELAQGGADS